MLKETERICPVCENDKLGRVLKNIAMQIPIKLRLPNSYDVVCCEKCGFCYADTTATKDDYDHYYKNFNTYSQSPKKTKMGQSTFELINSTMKEFFEFNSKLIDIGIGNGLFEIQAMEYGYKNIIGVDPSSTSVERLNNNGIKALVGNVYDEPDLSLHGKLDGVLLLSVLEHLVYPQKAIEQLKKYLSNDGKLFIVIPDYAKIDRSLTQQPNNFNQEHINYFSKESLKNLLSINGLKEIYNESIIVRNGDFKEYEILSVSKYEDNIAPYLIKKDYMTELAIEKYFQREDKNIEIRSQIIENLRKSKEPIMIWGTGAFTMNLLSETSLSKCNVMGYIDNNPLKIGTEFGDFKIYSPEAIVSFKDTIVICSMLYSEDIEKQIKDMGLSNKIIIIR